MTTFVASTMARAVPRIPAACLIRQATAPTYTLSTRIAARSFSAAARHQSHKAKRPASAVIPSNTKSHDATKGSGPSKQKHTPLTAAVRSHMQVLEHSPRPSKPIQQAGQTMKSVQQPTAASAAITATNAQQLSRVEQTQHSSPGPTRLPIDLPSHGRVDYVKQLTNITSPVSIYQAPSQRRFSIVCYGSMIFFVMVAKFNYNTIIGFAADNMWAYAYAGIICSMYGALALYCGLGPQKILRNITAVPSGPQHSGPQLEVTFKPILPFQKATPVQFAAADLTRDCAVAQLVEEKLHFNEQSFGFKGLKGLLNDVVNMFTRKSFVYVSFPKAGQCKVELPGAVNLGRGQALEQLVHLDTSKKMLFRKMFS